MPNTPTTIITTVQKDGEEPRMVTVTLDGTPAVPPGFSEWRRGNTPIESQEKIAARHERAQRAHRERRELETKAAAKAARMETRGPNVIRLHRPT